jgi:putative transposase
MAVADDRQCHHPGTRKRGDQTGKDPTNRGKLGTKRHFVVDGQGIPLGLTLSGANVHDSQRFRPTLEALAILRPSPWAIEQNLCADKAYDSDEIRLSAKRRGYIPHIPHRDTPAEPRKPGQKARRWVIERTNRWHNLFRRLRVRYDVDARNYQGFVELASAIICFRRARA